MEALLAARDRHEIGAISLLQRMPTPLCRTLLPRWMLDLPPKELASAAVQPCSKQDTIANPYSAFRIKKHGLQIGNTAFSRIQLAQREPKSMVKL
jgi:hypothetical protein